MCLIVFKREPGGGVFDLGNVKNESSVVSDRGECQLPLYFLNINWSISSNEYNIDCEIIIKYNIQKYV